MSELQRVRHWYEALQAGDLEAVLRALAPDIVWQQAEGHPYQPHGKPWSGRDSVMDNLFMKLAADWESFEVDVGAFHDGGATVVAEGRYRGLFKATGRRLDCQFCHVWHVQNGELARFQQYTDTAQVLAVTGFQPSLAQVAARRLKEEGVPEDDDARW